MNLRYYLRGLGIGIIVTAVIMGFTARKESAAAPSGEQVQAEDQQTEKSGGVLADLETGPAAEVTENMPSEQTPEPEDGEAEEEEETAPENTADHAEEETVPEPEEGAEAPEEGEAESPGSGDSILIEVSQGDSSYAVSVKLEEAGLIGSASAFDRYLYDNGYDRKLRFGTYEIPVDIDPEEIAEILAGNR